MERCGSHCGSCQDIVVIGNDTCTAFYSLNTQALHPSTPERTASAFLPKKHAMWTRVLSKVLHLICLVKLPVCTGSYRA